MDCSLPGSSVHGIFQARILEGVAISFSRGRTEQFHRRASRRNGPSPSGTAHPPPEAGGRGEGKGANSAPEMAPPPNCKQAPSLRLRLPEILDGQHLPGGSRLETSSPEQTQGARTRPAGTETEAGPAEEIRRTAPGKSAPVKLLAA